MGFFSVQPIHRRRTHRIRPLRSPDAPWYPPVFLHPYTARPPITLTPPLLCLTTLYPVPREPSSVSNPPFQHLWFFFFFWFFFARSHVSLRSVRNIVHPSSSSPPQFMVKKVSWFTLHSLCLFFFAPPAPLNSKSLPPPPFFFNFARLSLWFVLIFPALTKRNRLVLPWLRQIKFGLSGRKFLLFLRAISDLRTERVISLS